VELVEQDAGLRRVGLGGVPKRLPHVHHGHANPRALLGPQPREELVHAGLGAILAPEPDRPLPDQVAHQDAVDVALLDRDLVDTDYLRRRCPCPSQLLPHVLLLELLHRVPVEMQLLSDVLDRRGTTTTAHIEGEPPRVERVVGEEWQPLSLHFPALNALDPSYVDFQEHSRVPAREIPDPPARPVVEDSMPAATAAARRFFERR